MRRASTSPSARPAPCSPAPRAGARLALQSRMLAWLAKLLALAALVAPLAAGCGSSEDDGSHDPVGESADALSAPKVFVRSDQVHLGRAPSNPLDLHDLVADDFSHPLEAAARVVARHREHPTDTRPIYLGNIHASVYNDSVQSRADLHALA